MGIYTAINMVNKKAISTDTANVGNMTGMTYLPVTLQMATNKAEGTGQPYPRSSESKSTNNI